MPLFLSSASLLMAGLVGFVDPVGIDDGPGVGDAEPGPRRAAMQIMPMLAQGWAVAGRPHAGEAGKQGGRPGAGIGGHGGAVDIRWGRPGDDLWPRRTLLRHSAATNVLCLSRLDGGCRRQRPARSTH